MDAHNASESTIQNVFNIYRETIKLIPDIEENTVVYHYTSPEGLKGITDSMSLWATDINYLNDNSELRYIYQLARRMVDRKKKSWNAEFCESIIDHCDQLDTKSDLSNRLLFAHKEDYYVISFCLDQDNLNMWKYYTKTANSIGYNIGFSMHELCKAITDKELYSGAVIYDPDNQKRILEETLEKFEALYSDPISKDDKTVVTSVMFNVLNYLGVFFKHPAFIDEKEYRVVIRDHIGPQLKGIETINYRINDGVFIPYVTLPFCAECVKSIGISPSDKQFIAEYSVERMLEKKFNFGYSSYFRSSIPFNS